MASSQHDSNYASIQMDSSFSGEEDRDSTGSIVVDLEGLNYRRFSFCSLHRQFDHDNVVNDNIHGANCDSCASEKDNVFGRFGSYTHQGTVSDINNNKYSKQKKSTQCDF